MSTHFQTGPKAALSGRRPQDIDWGGDIDNKISSSIQNCSHLIVIISPASLKSVWVAYEIGQATAYGKKILPLLTHPSLELPDYIRYLNNKVGLEGLRNHFRNQNGSKFKVRTQL